MSGLRDVLELFTKIPSTASINQPNSIWCTALKLGSGLLCYAYKAKDIHITLRWPWLCPDARDFCYLIGHHCGTALYHLRRMAEVISVTGVHRNMWWHCKHRAPLVSDSAQDKTGIFGGSSHIRTVCIWQLRYIKAPNWTDAEQHSSQGWAYYKMSALGSNLPPFEWRADSSAWMEGRAPLRDWSINSMINGWIYDQWFN